MHRICASLALGDHDHVVRSSSPRHTQVENMGELDGAATLWHRAHLLNRKNEDNTGYGTSTGSGTLPPPLTLPPSPLRCRGVKLSMRRARIHHHCRRAGQIGVESLVVLEQSTYESDATTYNNDAPENRTPNPCTISYSISETAGRPLLSVAPPFAL